MGVKRSAPPQAADVKRVWAMRDALLLLDFEDPDTGPFKTMLLACTLHQIYLKSEEVSCCPPPRPPLEVKLFFFVGEKIFEFFVWYASEICGGSSPGYQKPDTSLIKVS